MKLGIGVAGAVIVLLGVVAVFTMQGNGGSKETTKVVTPAAVDSVAAAPVGTVAVPSVTSTSPTQSSQTTKA
ncbi:MAG: hypothetical protein M3326_11815, partial [Actinomycetota bacterium]|nr:hypothetical protein [Actinomycetota bacterium]